MSSEALAKACKFIARRRPRRQEVIRSGKLTILWEMSPSVESSIIELINEARRLVDAAGRDDGDE